MSELTDVAKALAVAAIGAQAKVFDQDAKNSRDAVALGKEVAALYRSIHEELRTLFDK